jgi:hypothetical protein
VIEKGKTKTTWLKAIWLRKLVKVSGIAAVLFLALLLTGIITTFRTPTIKGIVVDAETEEPIDDARIYAAWYRVYSGPGGPGPGGIAKEIRLRTKEDGTFKIPSHILINPVPYPFGQGGNFI